MNEHIEIKEFLKNTNVPDTHIYIQNFMDNWAEYFKFVCYDNKKTFKMVICDFDKIVIRGINNVSPELLIFHIRKYVLKYHNMNGDGFPTILFLNKLSQLCNNIYKFKWVKTKEGFDIIRNIIQCDHGKFTFDNYDMKYLYYTPNEPLKLKAIFYKNHLYNIPEQLVEQYNFKYSKMKFLFSTTVMDMQLDEIKKHPHVNDDMYYCMPEDIGLFNVDNLLKVVSSLEFVNLKFCYNISYYNEVFGKIIKEMSNGQT